MWETTNLDSLLISALGDEELGGLLKIEDQETEDEHQECEAAQGVANKWAYQQGSELKTELRHVQEVSPTHVIPHSAVANGRSRRTGVVSDEPPSHRRCYELTKRPERR